MGRWSEFDQAVADVICDRMAAGESLRAICREEGMPSESAVRTWAVKDVQGFHAQYTRAREAQMDALAEDILEISDDGSRDYRKDEDGREVPDHDHIARSRLRVDTRKWLMSKIAPKRFGERVSAEISGPDGGPIETAEISPTERARRIAFALQNGARKA